MDGVSTMEGTSTKDGASDREGEGEARVWSDCPSGAIGVVHPLTSTKLSEKAGPAKRPASSSYRLSANSLAVVITLSELRQQMPLHQNLFRNANR
jgi:hypothetical protein